ncbi:MAG: heavy metal translocating P-type ATPase [Clostridia bacterium]|nr:heavy metal translocating P-type ATPase [Clostridia bacterium]
METKKYNVTGMSCAACSAHVEKATKTVEGVTEVSVSLLTNSMTVSGNGLSDEKICSAVKAAGYGATVVDGEKSGGKKIAEEPLKDTETRTVLRRLIASLILMVPLMYLSMGHMIGLPLPSFLADNPTAAALCQMIISALVMMINQKFFINGFKGILRGAPNMDTLVALGSGAAFAYSTAVLFMMTKNPSHELLHGLYFESAAMILALITVGKMLEARSKGKTTDAIKRLMDLSPKTARVIRDGAETEIPADELITGDIFTVRPGESIPADGIVTEGESAVNESALTGESLPVDKAVGSKISAATINQNGFLVCKATHVGEDTTLSKIIELVENAASTKAPVAKLADKVSGIFVPTVISIAIITLIVWLAVGQTFGFALARAISVLVISCPCALGLATPVAVMVGSGVGAKNGILFKTAASLEAAGKTQIAVFDKTGTVTEGRPEVTDIITVSGTENDLIATAAALEAKSEHPIAKAIVRYVEKHNIAVPEAEDFSALPGHGVIGTVGGKRIIGGNIALMKDNGADISPVEKKAKELAESGKTPLYFAADGKLIGMIAVADKIKEDSKEAIEELKELGIRTVMLTGDNRATAKATAAAIGTEDAIAEVLPDGKEEVIRKLMESGKVAMIGDGINDAPALTRADTGIAVGAGTDIATDAADVVLMRAGIKDVPAAIRLSRQVLKNIKENLFWAFFYNVLCIPLAAGVFIPIMGLELDPMFGAAAMSLSSFFVVSNALRLNLFDIHKKHSTHKSPVDLPIIPGSILGNENTKTEKKTEETQMTKTIYIEGMMCEKCAAHVKKALNAVEGVSDTAVDLAGKKAVVTLTKDVDNATLKAAVDEEGYETVKIEG